MEEERIQMARIGSMAAIGNMVIKLPGSIKCRGLVD
jgi:hypothetical protein